MYSVLTTKFRSRLAAFTVVLVLAVMLLGWAAQSSWQRVQALNEEFSRDQLESYRTADRFFLELQHLQGLLLRFELRGDTNDWAMFDSDQKKLDDWLAEQRAHVYTGPERSALDAINRAYDDYQLAAKRLGERIATGISGRELTVELERTSAEFERLARLDSDLVLAHDHAREKLLDRSRRELTYIRAVLFAALTALLATGIGLARFVWSGLIEPLQRQLLESRELISRQDRLASLGVLAAGVAHEIRNPLTAIKARLFTQRKHLVSGSPAADDAAVIGAEIDRLEKIVRDFLQFARPADPEFGPVVLDRVFSDICGLLGEQLWIRDRINLIKARTEPYVVRADASQLKQVLLNLIQNAADAVGKNGAITLKAHRDVQRLRGDQMSVIVIEITDTGPGISAEAQPRLFDPFFTTKANGTGLGLSIASRIIEKHGGAIHYQTEAGGGTTFGVVLPEATNPGRVA
jgi:signal transduction histidine kinase